MRHRPVDWSVIHAVPDNHLSSQSVRAAGDLEHHQEATKPLIARVDLERQYDLPSYGGEELEVDYACLRFDIESVKRKRKEEEAKLK